MRNQLIKLQQHLVQGLVARDEMMKSALLAVLAGENVVLIGPPGTGKSLLARRISQSFRGESYFEYLLTKFSTPEELFGPLSISALKQDRFHRNTEGYLPSVRLAFLDEIFKASSSILNSLLTLLNERTYHNGTQAEKTPLESIVAASNELPNGEAELSALYDRFLIRRFVGYLNQNERNALFNLPAMTDIPEEVRLSADEIATVRQSARQVRIPENVADALQTIWQRHQEQFKDNADEQLSDRRFTKILHLIRISAVTNGRSEVDLSDLLLLKDCLWNDADNAEAVHQLILNVLQTFDTLIDNDKADGKDNTSQPVAQTAIRQPESAKEGTVLKGFAGSGTEQDPFLVEDLRRLKMLSRPDIGAAGYYFRQTADIDASVLGTETWLNIQEFNGHYDGGGFVIKGFEIPNATGLLAFTITVSMFGRDFKPLFGVLNGAEIHNLELLDVRLADFAEQTTLHHIDSNSVLVGDSAMDCQISHCRGYRIAGSAENCTIEYCTTSGDVLILDDAAGSVIHDCCVHLELDEKDRHSDGIARSLVNSTVERCYIQGSVKYTWSRGYKYFSGIADSCCEQSVIRHCAVGQLSALKDVLINHRITHEISDDSTLVNNIALSTTDRLNNSHEQTPNGRNGESVPPELFTQDYLNDMLDWDFERVWQWNAECNEPELRSNIVTETAPTLPENNDGKISLLLQQIQNNIWLGKVAQ